MLLASLIACKLQLSRRRLQLHKYGMVGKGAIAIKASAMDAVFVRATSSWAHWGQTLANSIFMSANEYRCTSMEGWTRELMH